MTDNTVEIVHPKTGVTLRLLSDFAEGGLWEGAWTEDDVIWIRDRLNPEPLYTLAQEICYTP